MASPKEALTKRKAPSKTRSAALLSEYSSLWNITVYDRKTDTHPVGDCDRDDDDIDGNAILIGSEPMMRAMLQTLATQYPDRKRYYIGATQNRTVHIKENGSK